MIGIDFREKLTTWQSGNKVIIFYLLIFLMLCLMLGFFTNFYPAVNDFWGNLNSSINLNFRSPASLYNGFYPIGYPIFLHLFLNSNPIIIAFISNIVFGLILLGTAALLGNQILGGTWNLMYVLALSLHPSLFTYINTPGGDIGSAAFATLGGVLLLCGINSEDRQMGAGSLYAAGSLFGLAALWRYHYLVLGFAFFFATSLVSKRKIRHIAICVSGFLTLYSLQVMVNLLSGHGPLETFSNFNLFMAMKGWPWHHIPSNIPTSMLGVILQDPVRFLAMYKDTLANYLPVAAPSIIGILVLKDRVHVRVNIAIAIVVLLYICVISQGGGSPRGIIPIAPYFLLGIFMVVKFGFESFYDRKPKNPWTVFVVSSILIFYLSLQSMLWIGEDLSHIKKARSQSKRIATVEKILIEKEKIRTPKQIVCTRSNIYLPSLKPYTFFPMGGGWADYILKKNKTAPKLSKENIFTFIRDCRKNNISHIILADNAGQVMEDFRALYNQTKSFDNLLFVDDVRGLRIYRIKPE